MEDEVDMKVYLTDNGDGITYYKLPKGFILYRGDSDPKYENKMVFDSEDREKFFGFDKETTEGEYGITFKFKTLQPLKLLALDKNNTPKFRKLVESKTDGEFNYDELVGILNKNYGYETGTRDSVSEKDKKLCSFICRKLDGFDGFDGYACDMMRKPEIEGGIFHAEAMICNPKDKLTEGKIVTPKNELHKHYDKWNMTKLGKEMEHKRLASKKRGSISEDFHTAKSPVRRSLFDNDDDSPVRNSSFDYDDNTYTSPVKRQLFGGNRKTKRKKTKQRKTKRKQQKITRRRKRQTK